MADLWMDVDTALAEVPVNIMPLLDDTDFKSIEGAVAYNASGMALRWHFVTTDGAYTVTSVTPTTSGTYDWTDQGDSGIYTIEIPASGGASINNDTEGFGWFTGVATGVLPWRGPIIGFRAAGLNNALIDSAYSATRGLAGTALPDAAAEAAGGLYTRGTGAGQINQPANGQVDVNVEKWNATNVPAEHTAGYPIVTVKDGTGTGEIDTTSGGVLVAALAANAITATSIASDAITDAKVASDVTIASVTGAVGSVTGAVGSVTGNVGGNVTGSVGSIATGGIAAASFAAGAIDAAAVANNAIDRATFAADTGVQTLRSNTAGGGANGSITLDASASAVDDFYKNALVVITGNTGVGQSRTISGYTGSTKVATITPNWGTNPDNTSTFAILPAGAVAGATAPTAGEVADAVWDEARSGHVSSGTFGEGQASVQGNVTGSVGSVVGAVGSVSGAVGSVTGNVGGNVTGSVGSVSSGGITAASLASDTITAAKIADNALTSAKFASGAFDAVWSVATRTLTSFGTVAADVWAVATRVLTAGTNIVLAKGTGVTGFNDLSAAQVNTEADTALADVGVTTTVTGRIDAAITTRASQTSVDTIDDFLDTEIAAIKLVTDQFTAAQVEPSAVPAANATPLQKIAWLAALARNKVTQTATTQTLRNDADSGTIATAAVSDDSTTFIRGEWT